MDKSLNTRLTTIVILKKILRETEAVNAEINSLSMPHRLEIAMKVGWMAAPPALRRFG
jgi:hypothetical protein